MAFAGVEVAAITACSNGTPKDTAFRSHPSDEWKNPQAFRLPVLLFPLSSIPADRQAHILPQAFPHNAWNPKSNSICRQTRQLSSEQLTDGYRKPSQIQFDGSTSIKCSTNDPRLPVMNSILPVKHMRNMGSTCLESRLCPSHSLPQGVPQEAVQRSAGLSDKCQIPIFFGATVIMRTCPPQASFNFSSSSIFGFCRYCAFCAPFAFS